MGAGDHRSRSRGAPRRSRGSGRERGAARRRARGPVGCPALSPHGARVPWGAGGRRLAGSAASALGGVAARWGPTGLDPQEAPPTSLPCPRPRLRATPSHSQRQTPRRGRTWALMAPALRAEATQPRLRLPLLTARLGPPRARWPPAGRRGHPKACPPGPRPKAQAGAPGSGRSLSCTPPPCSLWLCRSSGPAPLPPDGHSPQASMGADRCFGHPVILRPARRAAIRAEGPGEDTEVGRGGPESPVGLEPCGAAAPSLEPASQWGGEEARGGGLGSWGSPLGTPFRPQAASGLCWQNRRNTQGRGSGSLPHTG